VRADNCWLHLHPAFRERLRRAHAAVGAATGLTWVLVEGYRSDERQRELWAQGRTRPGPIVTWKRVPHWHGAGLAGDSVPLQDGQPWYGAGRQIWQALLAAGRAEGLENPEWRKGDLGHLQLTDWELRAEAQAWVRAGFGDPGMRISDQPVYVNGRLVPDADAFREHRKTWVWARAVIEAGGWAIASVDESAVYVVNDAEKRSAVRLAIRRMDARAFLPVRNLRALEWDVRWDPVTQSVRVSTCDGGKRRGA
jgi:hypothetical protein